MNFPEISRKLVFIKITSLMLPIITSPQIFLCYRNRFVALQQKTREKWGKKVKAGIRTPQFSIKTKLLKNGCWRVAVGKMDWKTWTCQRQAAIEEERDQTLREWNSRIDRLTTESNMGGPKTSPSHSKEGEGYAGFYHHLVANDSRGRPATSPSFKTQQRNPPKRDTNFERWISRKIPQTRRSQNSEWEDFKQDEAITLAIKKEIQRAFEQFKLIFITIRILGLKLFKLFGNF